MSHKHLISLNHRLNYYNVINKYLKKNYEKSGYKNCLKNYKYVKGKQTFKLGSKIITDNILGNGSYGIVFNAHFKYSSTSSKNLNIAIKITEITKENELEIELNKEVTTYIINNISPHFIIFYSVLLCDKTDYSSDISSLDINKEKYQIASILSNNEYYLILTELADGVFYDIAAYEPNNDIVHNCAVQCLLSMVFFNTLTNKSHDDTHLDNFLYSYIKKEGYFHYNIYGVDYYLKNVGYLIMINDFGLSVSLNNLNLIKDLIYFADKLKIYEIINITKLLKYEMQSSSFVEMDFKDKQKHIYSLLFKLLSETPEFKTQFFKSTTPPSKIINKTPYIIR